MSAFMVDKAHVDALVAVAVFGPSGREISPDTAWRGVSWPSVDWPQLADMGWQEAGKHFRYADHDYADEIGQMLVLENVRSIRYRYPDTVEHPEATPGPLDQYWEELYRFPVRTGRLSAVAALKAVDGFEYQACEPPGWHTSEAKRFCEALRRAVIGYLPGYRDAEWTLSDRVSS